MALTEEQARRYARQLPLPGVGERGQERLLAAKVLVIGAGGLGSSALLYLAAAGVGTLGVAEGDRVSLSNLQRQILYGSEDVGEEKLPRARRAAEGRNPDVRVQAHPGWVTADNIRQIIAPYDIVLDCTDRFEAKFLINDACVLSAKPYVHAGAVGFQGQVTTYVPGQGPCLRCLLGEAPPPEDAPTCAQAGILGAVTGVIGSLQALEAVKYLLGMGELLTGRVLCFDGLGTQARAVRFSADPDCPVCGASPPICALTGGGPASCRDAEKGEQT
ncbi:MAG: HesA/MoeB/ThiF family protein [Oscillospiraceae bacterium]|nr:HesA/MoeB/ThiF family protein [Oscillospiraceae bacterium]